MRDVAEGRDRLASIRLRRREKRDRPRVAIRGGCGRRDPQVVPEGKQALLRPVVEVPLEPAALGVRGLHEADA